MVAAAFWPVVGALVAGALIGLEREVRGRPAGFRTHILVCLASTLLMLAAARQRQWDLLLIPGETVVTDPTRMAHGVLTGIGFLCAGVIFRHGFSIHGLTTAASLWVTSAIGILFGVGLVELGAAATAVTLAVLAGLRVLDAHLPRRAEADVRVRYLRDRALDEAGLRALLTEFDLSCKGITYRLAEEGRVIEHTVRVNAAAPLGTGALAVRLETMPEVLEFDIAPHDD
jgi:putative Mg2+ transporter-C (MgtC) family protein